MGALRPFVIVARANIFLITTRCSVLRRKLLLLVIAAGVALESTTRKAIRFQSVHFICRILMETSEPLRARRKPTRKTLLHLPHISGPHISVIFSAKEFLHPAGIICIIASKNTRSASGMIAHLLSSLLTRRARLNRCKLSAITAVIKLSFIITRP